MKTRLIVITVVLLLAVLLPATAAYAAVTSKDVEKELMCQCGCTMVVDVCDCDTANQIRDKIAGMIDSGMDKPAILASFVGQYGEKILSAPTKKGFNLVAWIGPFAAVIGGGTGLFFLLRAWSRRGKPEPVAETGGGTVAAAGPDDAGYRGQLEAELRRYREEGTV